MDRRHDKVDGAPRAPNQASRAVSPPCWLFLMLSAMRSTQPPNPNRSHGAKMCLMDGPPRSTPGRCDAFVDRAACCVHFTWCQHAPALKNGARLGKCRFIDGARAEPLTARAVTDRPRLLGQESSSKIRRRGAACPTGSIQLPGDRIDQVQGLTRSIYTIHPSTGALVGRQGALGRGRAAGSIDPSTPHRRSA